MKVERLNTHLVQPSIPFEGSPPLLPLSTADLALPRVHVEILYAFNAPTPSSSAIKAGLSKVLTEYREWAGRLTEDASGRTAIELNDAGAVLIEAQAHGNLQEMWPFNPSHQLRELIPINRGVPELLLVQLTRFSCGGMTLGVARDHQVADGEAASQFMEAWGAAVQCLPLSFTPVHDRSILMARDPPQPIFDHIEYQRPAPKPDASMLTEYPILAIKKLHFSTELLKKIKVEAIKGAEAGGVVYTTFVTLLAHLWKCITKARGLEDDDGETRARIAVNFRKRIEPAVPKGYFGNAMCLTCAQANIKDLVKEPLSFAAGHVHAAIKKVNSEYVRSALDFMEMQQRSKSVQIARMNKPVLMTPNLSVTSWTKLPLYDLDFGSGKPLFAGSPFIPFEGLLMFLPSHERDGSVDVALGLCAPAMQRLESICFAVDG